VNRRRIAGVLAVVAIVLAGCSPTDPPAAARVPQEGDVTVTPGPDGVQAVTLVTRDNFRYVPDRFTVVPGTVRLTVDNESGTVHDLHFDVSGTGKDIPSVRSGTTETVEFTVSKPGEFGFVCTFHEQFGQTGTMVVLP